MSDKSKLGFNINPKNYDELNSTDNLITSGSDSGWLGKKLQGDNNSTIDLSKINPLFDKDLYEKYRPGVNTNDGSVNQDIWGYKCFNSPVSFRNGIYGDTYSIQSVDTYTYDAYRDINNNGIIIQPYNKYAKKLNDKNNVFRIYNENINEKKNYNNITYVDSEEVYHQYGYTGKENNINTYDLNVYDILKSAHIDGTYNESISYEQNHELTNNDGTQLKLLINSYDYNVVGTSSSTRRKDTTSYNGITTFSNKKNDKQAYAYQDAVNITSSIYYTNNIGTDEEPKHNYNISRITIGTECGNDPVIEKEITANNNCIRMYSADGTHGNSGYTNDNISSIIITPDYISISAKNNANQSADNPYIKIDGADNSITLHAGKLNLPDTIETATKFAVKAGALSKDADSTNYIYASDNSILPSNDSVISLGDLKTKYNTIYANRLIGIASAAEKLVYVNPTNNAETELLTVSNENLILPRGNETIQLGRADNRFGTIYGDLNGTAVIADHAVTAEQATKDQDGNIIKSSYLNILDFGRNDIESYNAIIGNEKEKLLFLKEKYFDYNGDIPPKNKSYASIQCAFTDTLTSYKTTISWSNEAEDKPITKLCHVDYNLVYNDTTKKHSFYFIPNGVAPDDPKYVESMNIGAPYAPWDNLYCNKFPTIAGTTDTTSVGNIRLLCIKGPTTLTTIEHGIKHGSIIKNPMQIDGKQFTIHIANLRIVDNSQNFIGVTGEKGTVEGEWQLLSSALVVANSPSRAVFTPVLAMRVL